MLEKQRVLQANDEATGLGVKPGMSSATARALAEDICLLERDRDAEQRCLQQLCGWAYSISPNLYPYREDSLLLEVGGCLMLHGGIESLLSRVHSELSCRGYSYRPGLASTPKAAWLLSYSELSSIQPQQQASSSTNTPQAPNPLQQLEQQLAPLSLHLLPDFPRQLDALAKAGLWTFGDILDLPQQALGRRCGREFVHYLQQILGTAEDRAPDFKPPESFSDDYWFGYEVKANQELLPAVQLLLQSLCRFLRNTQLQSQQVEWLLYGINRKLHRFEVRCSVDHANWQEWYQLTQLKIDQLQLDNSIEGVGLRCPQLVAGNARSEDLFEQVGQREPLHSLLDRLKNRLGLQSVKKIACRDEHLPEFAGYSSCDTRLEYQAAASGETLRPFWLMPEPQRLRQTGEQPHWNGRLTLLEGPERIEDNWWVDAVSRDYYIARDPSGQQYWIYRDRLQDNWYIQGVFP
ncbi:MAG: DNA polymerase Y family protein [Halieaceae bacterium]